MLIYLLRHAMAETRAETDAARELTVEGEAQARVVAEKFKSRSPTPDKIICSPYLRAQQTAAIVLAQFPNLKTTIDESVKPGADVYALLDALEAEGLQQMILVSHNPLLSNLLSVLVDGTMGSNRHMGNCTLSCISMDLVAPGCGELLYTLEP
jgi:phosphohistidine phosphatase